MSKFYAMEVNSIFKIYNACKEHEKFFFILHQGTLDGSFLWENNKVVVKHYDHRIRCDLDNDSRSLINHSKFFLFFYDGLTKILQNQLNQKFSISGDYEIIKTNSQIDFDISPEEALIYLPQTNQMLRYTASKDFDRRIFITHEYVVVIPIELRAPSRT